ncbi:hypothetical protein PYCCODRAFT_635387 [Trametes coccinea BRFM310]|uniref:Uncharacterized protein n=1 Tax=Trametes coccinea (strain BRFM310) TaxID=1353009 RepID=A0A1Y2IJM4_TRAC3|nr:hypothetical protein PYCCODRAFT_635387 [Trametes coccinea BRFM310]
MRDVLLAHRWPPWSALTTLTNCLSAYAHEWSAARDPTRNWTAAVTGVNGPIIPHILRHGTFSSGGKPSVLRADVALTILFIPQQPPRSSEHSHAGGRSPEPLLKLRNPASTGTQRLACQKRTIFPLRH